MSHARISIGVLLALTGSADAQHQWLHHARDAQHTGLSSVASQCINGIRWQMPVDLAPQYTASGNLLIHYGSPLMTAANAVIVPVKTGATGGFRVEARDGLTGALWCGVDESGVTCMGNDAARTQPVPVPTSLPLEENRGGPPTIADFDGDGRAEVGVAGATEYVVFDFNRDGEEIVQPGGDPPPGPGDAYVRWATAIQDGSSNLTGSSSWSNVHERGSRSGRQRTYWPVWRRRSPSMWS